MNELRRSKHLCALHACKCVAYAKLNMLCILIYHQLMHICTNINHKFHFHIHLCQKSETIPASLFLCVCVCTQEFPFYYSQNEMKWIFRIFATVKLWIYDCVEGRIKKQVDEYVVHGSFSIFYHNFCFGEKP